MHNATGHNVGRSGGAVKRLFNEAQAIRVCPAPDPPDVGYLPELSLLGDSLFLALRGRVREPSKGLAGTSGSEWCRGAGPVLEQRARFPTGRHCSIDQSCVGLARAFVLADGLDHPPASPAPGLRGSDRVGLSRCYEGVVSITFHPTPVSCGAAGSPHILRPGPLRIRMEPLLVAGPRGACRSCSVFPGVPPLEGSPAAHRRLQEAARALSLLGPPGKKTMRLWTAMRGDTPDLGRRTGIAR